MHVHGQASERRRRRRAGGIGTTITLALGVALLPAPAAATPAQPVVSPAPVVSLQGEPARRDARPRTIVTTDGEADDMNSMIRFLYYTNDIDVAGLVYSSSVHHWEGDGTHTLKQAKDAGIITSYNGQTAGTADRSDDATKWRWNPDQWIQDQIDDYAEILPNLRAHDKRYPSAKYLRSKVAVGNVAFENDFSADTPGSRLIERALLDGDQRDLWLQAWGGQNTIARALVSIEDRYKGTPQWASVRRRVVDKAVIATIGNQDNAYADYISKSWPDIRLYNWGFTFTAWTGGKRQADIPARLKKYYEHQFWTKMKSSHGDLLAGYHLIGDGQYLKGESDAPGWQPGLAGVKYDLATWRLYDFVGPFERYDMLSEGDTPAFLPLIPNGLRFLDDPTLGGWGGRFAPGEGAAATAYSPQPDVNPASGKAEGPYSLIRWVGDAERDFAARADWGVTRSKKSTNRAPQVKLARTDVTAKPGAKVKITSVVRDPDGDKVKQRWSVYEEASTVTSVPAITTKGHGSRRTTTVSVPRDAAPGQRLVLLLKATDNGKHHLARYGEVVVMVR